MKVRLYKKLIIKLGLLAVLFSIILVSCTNHKDSRHDPGLSSLFQQIDSEINKTSEYDLQKERKIEILRNRMSQEQNPLKVMEICDEIIGEFESYQSDSALYYINKNLESARLTDNRQKELSLLIRKSDIAAHAGLFAAASSILNNIDSSELDSLQKELYFSALCDLYQYQSEYVTDDEFVNESVRLREAYIDSIAAVSPPTSINYVIYTAAAEAREGNIEKAENLLKENIGLYGSGERNYSILASLLADVAKAKGDLLGYRLYLGLAVISDLQGSIKENMAIRALATSCYEDGDIERADRYLRQSFADANFFSARMRNAQSSRMLPVIGEAYSGYQLEMRHKLRGYIITVSILAFVLICIIAFTVKQFFIVKRANSKSNNMLKEVSSLSDQLREVNQEILKANIDLKKSNEIKEEYAALFMEYCSLAISNLQQYHQSLRVLAAQGNTKTLLKKIDSTEMVERLLKDFYQRFDEAILNIYPDFVEKFNRLLKPEYAIELKPGEALNTELRVFALIRIGITDSDKIAGFLRCSLSTIYTYRSKTKKRSINPDEFENDVKNIE